MPLPDRVFWYICRNQRPISILIGIFLGLSIITAISQYMGLAEDTPQPYTVEPTADPSRYQCPEGYHNPEYAGRYDGRYDIIRCTLDTAPEAANETVSR